MSAIDSVPQEILAKILFFVADTLTLPRVSSVSRHWRHVCLAAPELWSVLEVPFFRASDRFNIVDWVKRCLDLSRACPIHVTLTFMPWKVTMDSAVQVVEEISKHSHRLRTFHVKLFGHGSVGERTFGPDGLSHLLEPFRRCGEAPMLEELVLQLPPRDIRMLTAPRGVTLDPVPPFIFTDKAQGTSHLKSVRLRGIGPPLPLVGLTSLVVHELEPTIAGMSTLFTNCPALATLSLVELGAVNGVPAHSAKVPQIISTSVTSFKLTHRYLRRDERSLLEVLAFPNLVDLTIGGEMRNLPPAFVEQLGSLQILEFDSVVQQSEVVNASSLFPLPALRHLKFFYCACPSLVPLPDSAPRAGARRLSIGSSALSAVVRAPTAFDNDILRLLRHAGPPPLPRQVRAPQGPVLSQDTWPLLETVTLGSIRPQDVKWVCDLVRFKPSLRHIQLSSSAMRHLKGSLRLDGDTINVPDLLSVVSSRSDRMVKGEPGVDRWLASRADVSVFSDERVIDNTGWD